jgi:hypothetical protein
MSKALKFLFPMMFVLKFTMRLFGAMTVKRLLLAIPVILLTVLAFNTMAIALVWNVVGIHSVLGAGTLSFTQCVVLGALLMCFGM